jgi:hypothetical protein
MWELLLVVIVLAFLLLKTRERFIIKYGNPFDNEDIVSFDYDAKGTRLFAANIDLKGHTCPSDKSQYDAGLCYERCEEGYHGVGPVCWANTENRGIGKPVGLEPCPAGWSNDGLICREPLRWNSCKWRGLFNECWGGAEGGRLRGRLNNGGICDWPADRGNLPNWLVDKSDPKDYKATHPDRVDGLCYKRCPAEKPNAVPGMPYLCYKNIRGFAYGRGVGSVPPPLKFGA